jgi:plasmid stabilization system protein ParE
VKVRLVPAARLELLEAYNYHEEQQVRLGHDFAVEVSEAVKEIVRHPLACPPRVGGTRRCRLKRFAYGIVYRVLKTEIRVLAIMHLHRRPGYWRGRG